jgi:hypothetical protein
VGGDGGGELGFVGGLEDVGGLGAAGDLGDSGAFGAVPPFVPPVDGAVAPGPDGCEPPPPPPDRRVGVGEDVVNASAVMTGMTRLPAASRRACTS